MDFGQLSVYFLLNNQNKTNLWIKLHQNYCFMNVHKCKHVCMLPSLKANCFDVAKDGNTLRVR